MELHVYMHGESDKALVAINAALSHILERINIMSNELEQLRAAVASNRTVTGSAIALLQGIKAKLDAAIASNDPRALAELSQALAADDQALAAAITANTPGAPTGGTGGAAEATTTTLTSSANPVMIGMAFALKAKVTGKSPTGSVNFMSGADVVGFGSVGANGEAELSITFAQPGSHSMTAEYSGDAANAASTSQALNLVSQ